MAEAERPDDSPPADPFEAELVAYLDGELDPVAAQRVEERLAVDPESRARAVALKKTFDLLEFLPKTEPSPNFTTRTLDRIPALQSGSQPAPRSPRSDAESPPGNASFSIPLPVFSSAVPVSESQSSRLWFVAIPSIVLACGLIGYGGAAALRPLLFPASPQAEELPLSDHRIIENLPLYAAVDDFEFVQKLADLLADDPALAPFDGSRTPGVAPEKTSRPAFEALAQSFRDLPAARQQSIRELDHDLHAADAETREQLFRVLESYGIWLDRLPEAERRGVLAAATPGLRLAVIRDIRERQWLDGLPALQRAQLAGLSDAAKAERIKKWKDEETRQRNRWHFVRKNAEAISGLKAPWPFDTETGRKEVIDFIRAVYRTDEPKRSRLSPIDLASYRAELASAQGGGSWAWFGKTVYDLTRARRYEILPESPNRKLMVVDFEDLPPGPGLARFVERPLVRKQLVPLAGRWPDFALEIHESLRQFKLPSTPIPALGPASVEDFQEPVRRFWTEKLAFKLSARELAALKAIENRWPDYPREFLRLARAKDLSVPGVMLPGSPQRWDATYGDPFRGAQP